jgi:C4-dicarboxylate-specific signal transduction histidine kinase
MNQTPNPRPGRESAFFRKIGADVSHEIRNTLSIIAEYAGLAADLLALDEDGRCRDPVRVKELAARIVEQVRAGTETMERFSRVVHAADEQTTSFDLAALTENVAALSRRRAAQSGCRLEVRLPHGKLSVRANPLNLQCVLLSAIELILECRERDTPATIEVSAQGSVAGITISGRARESGNLPDRIAEISAVMDLMQGTAKASWEAGILVLTLGLPIHD